MADMFGAPIGQGAAETDIRQVAQGALLAQKALGEIGMQPAEKALKEAHAKLYEEEARQKEIANQSQQQMLGLSAGFSKQEAQAAIVGMGNQGKIATINDVGLNGQPPVNSPLARQQRWIKYLEDQGAPEMMVAPLRKELAAETQHYAAAEHNIAQAAEQKAQAQKKGLERRAAWAMAIQKDPTQYPRMLQEALNDPDPEVQKRAAALPTVYNPRVINSIIYQGVEAAKQIDQEREERQAKARIALEGARTEAAKASTKLRGVRADIAAVDLDVAKKFRGPTAEATLQKKQQSVQADAAKADALDNKNFTGWPVDPKQFITPGKGYKAPNGQRVIYVGRDKAGEPQFEPASEYYKKNVVDKRASAMQGPAEEDE